MLDGLLKEILKKSTDMNISSLIPVLKQYLAVSSPTIRRMAISWIAVHFDDFFIFHSSWTAGPASIC